MTGLQRGFIYTVPLPKFSYPKSEQVKEFEIMVNKTLTEPQALIFDMGYKWALIDTGNYETMEE